MVFLYLSSISYIADFNALAIVHHLVIQGLVVVVDPPYFQWIITGILNGPRSIRVELVAELIYTRKRRAVHSPYLRKVLVYGVPQLKNAQDDTDGSAICHFGFHHHHDDRHNCKRPKHQANREYVLLEDVLGELSFEAHDGVEGLCGMRESRHNGHGHRTIGM